MSGSNPITRAFGFVWRLIERLVKSIQVLIFLLFAAIIVSALLNLSGGGIEIPESAAMLIAPNGRLVDQPEGEPLDQAFSEMQGGEGQTVVRQVVESLEFAANDERIKAVVFLPDYMSGGGLSKQQTIAAAIQKFKESGKPVIAMADSYDQSQYFLAANADEIYMHDFGFVLIEGFGYFKTYFADALEKLKVDVNVFRVGEYKSFVEPYLRNDMSEQDKEDASRWLLRLWEIYQQDVIAARELDPDAFERYVTDLTAVLLESNGDAAVAAMSSGLVDGLMSHQEFRNYMIDKVGIDEEQPDTFAHIDYRNYLIATKFSAEQKESKRPRIAVIVASGNIVDGEASPGTVGSATLNQLIRQASNDDNVAAVVLQIDSPGGSMFASEVIFDQLEALRGTGKPLVASMSTLAASGGYYIAMAADEIWARESTITGSIGVGAMFPTFQRSLASLGVNIDGFGTTPFAGQLTPVRKLGNDARELMDISVRSAYDVFIGKVAEARDMDIGRVDEIAQGRIWIGGDALEIGLVDNLGGIEEAIDSAATLAGLTEGEYSVQYVERELSFAERLIMQYAKILGLLFSYSGADIQGMGPILQGLSASMSDELELLNTWNDPRGLYLHCMCEID